MVGSALKSEIEHLFQVVKHKSTAEEMVILCPECGDQSGHRSINLKTGQTFCFRCNKGKHNKGHLIGWAKALGHQLAHAGDFTAVNLDNMFEHKPASTGIPLVTSVKLPEGFATIKSNPKSVYTKLISEMAVRKNLLKDDFIEAGVGFTRENPRWEPFAIFPVEEYGRVVYYQGRTYVDVPGESTKLFPSRKECPFGASNFVYNIDTVRATKASTVIVVESILNVLSLRWKLRELGVIDVVPVCVFKHFISEVQMRKMLKLPKLKEICVIFDHDAIDKTWDMLSLLGHRIKMTIAEMPSDGKNKKMDPNDDVEAALIAFDKRKAYSGMTAVGHGLDLALRPRASLNGVRF